MEKHLELCFICRKCGHNLFVDETKGWVKKLIKDCPSCGEEGEENWILRGYGNYKKEFDK